MKIVGLVGSNAQPSYNRLLLQYIKVHFSDLFDMELVEIDQIPLFNQDEDQTQTEVIRNIETKLKAADGVIISTAEHNHTIPPVLKSCLEWLSFKIHPLDQKPVMVIGASYYQQGSSRAQLHLRQILDAPGVNAFVMPGNEFLLANAKAAFDAEACLKDPKTIAYLSQCLNKFKRFTTIVNQWSDEEHG
ncbi:NADPH-dependent FMN reductase [Vaginisenegalia massiliensis]|uniref:NADPH-dependent FMN reductase n=1 Tax=Vaginisenegalia massiliensis TaxID=2058294 RepID=UPI000F548453|nr:NADPH-dependent FMN reductase [Vaginisenegalia massiliensis]